MADIAQTITYKTTTASPQQIPIVIAYTAGRIDSSSAYVDFTVTVPANTSIQWDYDIYCKPVVDGSTKTEVRIKAFSPFTWSSPIVVILTRYTFSAAAAVTSVNASLEFYNTTLSAWGYGLASGTVSFPAAYTNPVRGSVSATPSVFETMTLSWSGFKHGTSNNIRAYDLYYQQSTNNSSWGSAVKITTITSSSTSGSYSWSGGTRSYYYRFNVVAVGTVSGTYSNQSTYTGSIRKNQVPAAPSNLRYENPDTSKLYMPELSAVLLWNAASDPDGQTVTYEVQTLKRNAANNGWDNDTLYTTSGTTLTVDISSKPRGKTLAIGDTAESLSFMVRSKDTLGVYSAWVTASVSYARNPTAMYGGSGGVFVSGIAYVCVDGQWRKAEVYAGVSGVWIPTKI